jgi:hypothetical protein
MESGLKAEAFDLGSENFQTLEMHFGSFFSAKPQISHFAEQSIA